MYRQAARFVTIALTALLAAGLAAGAAGNQESSQLYSAEMDMLLSSIEDVFYASRGLSSVEAACSDPDEFMMFIGYAFRRQMQEAEGVDHLRQPMTLLAEEINRFVHSFSQRLNASRDSADPVDVRDLLKTAVAVANGPLYIEVEEQFGTDVGRRIPFVFDASPEPDAYRPGDPDYSQSSEYGTSKLLAFVMGWEQADVPEWDLSPSDNTVQHSVSADSEQAVRQTVHEFIELLGKADIAGLRALSTGNVEEQLDELIGFDLPGGRLFPEDALFRDGPVEQSGTSATMWIHYSSASARPPVDKVLMLFRLRYVDGKWKVGELRLEPEGGRFIEVNRENN